ncbi:hypothetical protein FA95DRAFT_118701 [Auriscalpium vulgare]|uniref:Uncharacterized protein n=1 Tax=Auriscalpium vulgare TaxID=40419 RepID=A0ACB8RNA6_9AGAM|nr:hypothetical protein FA95DRAFT_118701 [Auriscalpium vulgare]
MSLRDSDGSVYRPPSGAPGAIIIGVVLGSFLYGVTSQQVIFYFTNFSRDSLVIRLWVVALWILDTTTTALEVCVVYQFYVRRYGESDRSPFDHCIAAVLTGATIFLVQAFFVFRIRQLRKTVFPASRFTNAMFAFFSILALFALATSIQLTYYDLRDPNSQFRRPIYISNISIGTGLDVFITIAMVLLLHQHINEFAGNRNPIEQLIFFFITRGIILTLAQVLQVTLTYAAPGNSWFAVFTCISKVYANSALVTLNNRERLERQSTGRSMDDGYACDDSVELVPSFDLTTSTLPRDGPSSVSL